MVGANFDSSRPPITLSPREIGLRNTAIGRFVFEGIRDAAGDVFSREIVKGRKQVFDPTAGNHDSYLRLLGQRTVAQVGLISVIKPTPEDTLLVYQLSKDFPGVVIPQSLSGTTDDFQNQLIAFVSCREAAKGYVTMVLERPLSETPNDKKLVQDQLIRMVRGMGGNTESMKDLGAQIVKEVREKTGATSSATA